MEAREREREREKREVAEETAGRDILRRSIMYSATRRLSNDVLSSPRLPNLFRGNVPGLQAPGFIHIAFWWSLPHVVCLMTEYVLWSKFKLLFKQCSSCIYPYGDWLTVVLCELKVLFSCLIPLVLVSKYTTLWQGLEGIIHEAEGITEWRSWRDWLCQVIAAQLVSHLAWFGPSLSKSPLRCDVDSWASSRADADV